MLARLGSNAFERYDHERAAGGLTVRRHIGWRWPCDCSTFARPEGDYLWVACREHDVERQPARRFAEDSRSAARQ